jgi:hypothetical protein
MRGWWAVLFWCAGALAARADGGYLALTTVQGSHVLSVFVSPDPPRVGPVDVSVLLQERASGLPAPAVVTVSATPPGGRGPRQKSAATTAAATNKIFSAAPMLLDTPGVWKMDVDVQAPSGILHAQCAVPVAPGVARWQNFWPYFSWPLVVILLVALNRRSWPE